jgi:nucleotide-binding universal stress UspA family protein
MFQKILVPTDGSDHAARAVAVASDLAVKYGAELVVLHVMEEVGSSRIPAELQSYAKMEHADVSERDMLESVANQIVRGAEIEARKAGIEAVAHEVALGSPGPTIAEYAEKHGVDLIVMGRRGLGRVADLLLGSVSHRVTQLADRACLTIK